MAEHWTELALCRDEELQEFFSNHGRAGYGPIKDRLCYKCPVGDICLWYAMSTEEPGHRHGLYGGMSPEERQELSKTVSRDQARQYLEEELRRFRLG